MCAKNKVKKKHKKKVMNSYVIQGHTLDYNSEISGQSSAPPVIFSPVPYDLRDRENYPPNLLRGVPARTPVFVFDNFDSENMLYGSPDMKDEFPTKQEILQDGLDVATLAPAGGISKSDNVLMVQHSPAMSDFSHVNGHRLVEWYNTNKLRFAGVSFEAYHPTLSFGDKQLFARRKAIQISSFATISVPSDEYDKFMNFTYIAWVPEVCKYSYLDAPDHHSVKLVFFDMTKTINKHTFTLDGEQVTVHVKPHHIIGKLIKKCELPYNGITLQLASVPAISGHNNWVDVISDIENHYQFNTKEKYLTEEYTDTFNTETLKELVNAVYTYVKSSMKTERDANEKDTTSGGGGGSGDDKDVSMHDEDESFLIKSSHKKRKITHTHQVFPKLPTMTFRRQYIDWLFGPTHVLTGHPKKMMFHSAKTNHIFFLGYGIYKKQVSLTDHRSIIYASIRNGEDLAKLNQKSKINIGHADTDEEVEDEDFHHPQNTSSDNRHMSHDKINIDYDPDSLVAYMNLLYKVK